MMHVILTFLGDHKWGKKDINSETHLYLFYSKTLRLVITCSSSKEPWLTDHTAHSVRTVEYKRSDDCISPIAKDSSTIGNLPWSRPHISVLLSHFAKFKNRPSTNNEKRQGILISSMNSRICSCDVYVTEHKRLVNWTTTTPTTTATAAQRIQRRTHQSCMLDLGGTEPYNLPTSTSRPSRVDIAVHALCGQWPSKSVPLLSGKVDRYLGR